MDSVHLCSRCVLTNSFPRIQFDDKGVCSVCNRYEKQWGTWNSSKVQKTAALEKICRQAKSQNREFDALVPLSGGKDSTYVLYIARKQLGLKCLAYTLDIGYLSQYAKNNIEKTCKTLGVEHIYYRIDQDLINRLFNVFIKKNRMVLLCLHAGNPNVHLQNRGYVQNSPNNQGQLHANRTTVSQRNVSRRSV